MHPYYINGMSRKSTFVLYYIEVCKYIAMKNWSDEGKLINIDNSHIYSKFKRNNI